MDHDLVDLLDKVFVLARNDVWTGPLPAAGQSTLKLGLLVMRIRKAVPLLWNLDPETAAAELERSHPVLVTEILRCDPRALGFVMRMHRMQGHLNDWKGKRR